MFLTLSSTIAIAAISAGCASGIADSSCKVFRPLSWSKKDTIDTQREVVSHNRAYEAICPAPKLTADNYP